MLLKKPFPFSSMPDFYRSLDLYICASDNEGTPNTVLEAMATGVAVISTDVGIVPELFGEKQSKFILKERSTASFKNNMLKFLNNPELIKTLGEENLNEIGTWTWENQSTKFSEFFTNASQSFNSLTAEAKEARMARILRNISNSLLEFSLNQESDLLKKQNQIALLKSGLNKSLSKKKHSSNEIRKYKKLLQDIEKTQKPTDFKYLEIKSSVSYRLGFALTRIPAILIDFSKLLAGKFALISKSNKTN